MLFIVVLIVTSVRWTLYLPVIFHTHFRGGKMRCRNSYTSVLGDAQRYIWGANLISSLRKTSPRGLALRLGSLRSRHFSVLKSAACIMHPPACLRKCLAATGTRRAVNKLPQLRFESFKEGLLWLVMTWLLEKARERGWI